MAKFDEHVEQSDHNEEVAAYILEREDYRDWAITVAFYCAVHLAEALFALKPSLGQTKDVGKRNGMSRHTIRKHAIRDNVPNASSIYNALHTASQQLRYLEYDEDGSRQALFHKHFPQSVAQQLVTQELPELRQEFEKVAGRRLTNR